jgi:peptide/nickel transport system permease protein
MAQDQAIPQVAAPEFALPKQAAWWKGVLKFCRRKPLGAIGMAIVIVLCVLTLGTPTGEVGVPELPDRPLGFELGPPWFQRYDPEANFFDANGQTREYESPTSNHWLGTDRAGRDVWSRTVNGARRSLTVGLWALGIATLIGTTIGVISGYFGRWSDTVIQRIMDALQCFPPLILLILIIALWPGDLTVVAIALGIVGITSVQRIVRGVVLSTREQQYVEAARVIGASDVRTMAYYILPNITASIIVVFSTGLGVVILAESAVGFIAPDKVPVGPSWGTALNEAQPVIADYPWPGISAAGAIALAVLGFNLAGDALRDVLDPRLRL